jgi:opacity protein-like surface antigen
MDDIKVKINSAALMLGLLMGVGHNSVVFAGAMGPVGLMNNNSWYLGVSGSVLWSSLPDGLSINNGAVVPFPFNTDLYSIEHGTDGALAVQAGYEWQRGTQWFPSYSLGLQYEHYWLGAVNGTITQYSIPEFLNYSYTWDIQSDSVSLYSKVHVAQLGAFKPFVNAGIGLAINRSGHVYETPFAGVTPRVAPGFGKHSQNNFAYNFGAGVDYTVSTKLSVSLAYNYQNLGSVRSSNGVDTWSGDNLNIKHYEINMLVLGLTYRFDS